MVFEFTNVFEIHLSRLLRADSWASYLSILCLRKRAHVVVQLAAEAIPVAFLVTSLAASRPSPLPPRLLKTLVCLLLIATGVGMIGAALSAHQSRFELPARRETHHGAE